MHHDKITVTTAVLTCLVKPSSEKLRASLEHHFDVLPEHPTGLLALSPAEFQQSLEQDFARSFVSVHPLSETPRAARSGWRRVRVVATAGARAD